MDGEGILECRECRQLLFSFWPAAINNGFSFACQSLPPKIGATSKIGATLPIYPIFIPYFSHTPHFPNSAITVTRLDKKCSALAFNPALPSLSPKLLLPSTLLFVNFINLILSSGLWLRSPHNSRGYSS